MTGYFRVAAQRLGQATGSITQSHRSLKLAAGKKRWRNHGIAPFPMA